MRPKIVNEDKQVEEIVDKAEQMDEGMQAEEIMNETEQTI